MGVLVRGGLLGWSRVPSPPPLQRCYDSASTRHFRPECWKKNFRQIYATATWIHNCAAWNRLPGYRPFISKRGVNDRSIYTSFTYFTFRIWENYDCCILIAFRESPKLSLFWQNLIEKQFFNLGTLIFDQVQEGWV